MQPTGDHNPVSHPFSSEIDEKNSTNTKSQNQEIELQLRRSEPDGQPASLYSESIPENSLYTQTTSGYNPIYQPISMSTENTQQNLVHHIEDDVPPPKQPEPPKQKAKRAKRPWKSCFKKKRDPYDCDQVGMIDKVLFFIFLGFVFGVLGLLIALSVYDSHNTEANLTPVAGALSYIAFNLASHPILDIRVQDNNIPCPEDYESMVLGTWPGTIPGCLCGSVLKRGHCDKSSENPQDTGCDDIAPRSPINMFDWKDDKWCILRVKPQSQYEKAEKCSPGFRKCSSGLCVLNSLDCPVTGMKKEGNNFVAEIVEGESPMIDVRITPNNVSCFGVDSFARGPIPMYILIDADEWGCSRYGLDDEYSFFLDSQKQKELFYQNDFPLSVLDLRDYRYVYEHTDAVLSERKRLDITEKDFCLNLDTELLEKASKAMHDLQRYMSGTSLAGIIIQSILCGWVVPWLVPLIFCCSSLDDLLSRFLGAFWFAISVILGLMVYIDIIVMFGGMIYYRKKMLEIKEYFVEIEGSGCFLGEKAQSVVNDYQVVGNEVSWNLFQYSLALFVVSTVTIFPSFYMLWRSIKRDFF